MSEYIRAAPCGQLMKICRIRWQQQRNCCGKGYGKALLASALLLLIIGQPYFVTVLRYLSTCMLVMTFLVTTCVLIPMDGNPRKLLWSGNGLYHHVLCPVISTASYILAENHAAGNLIWLPAVITLAYGLVMLYLNWVKKVDGPYPFSGFITSPLPQQFCG